MDNQLSKVKIYWDKLDKVFKSLSIDDSDEKSLKSIYNTEIINPVTFDSGFHYFKPHGGKSENVRNDFFMNKTFQDFHNNMLQGDIMQKKYMDKFVLPPTTICQFHRSKNIVKTNMPLGMGTKKEFYGFNDWEITIQILCLKEANRTAIESRDLIIDWAMLLDKINVIGDIFNKKKIFSIVIEDIDIKTIAGRPETIPIELRCVSTEPNELFLNQKLEEQFFNKKELQDFDKRMKDTDFNNFPI